MLSNDNSSQNKNANFLIGKFRKTYEGGYTALNWAQCQFNNEFTEDNELMDYKTIAGLREPTIQRPEHPVLMPETIEEDASDAATANTNITANAASIKSYENRNNLYVSQWKAYDMELEQYNKKVEKAKKIKSRHAEAFAKLYELFHKDADLINKVSCDEKFKAKPTLFNAIKVLESEIAHVDASGTQASEYFTKVLNLAGQFKRNNAANMKLFLAEVEKFKDEAQVLKPRYAPNDETTVLDNILTDLFLAACKAMLPDPNTVMGNCFMHVASEIRKDGHNNGCLRDYQNELEKEQTAAKAKANSSVFDPYYKGGRYSKKYEREDENRQQNNSYQSKKRECSESPVNQCVLHPSGAPHELKDCSKVNTMMKFGKHKELEKAILDAKSKRSKFQRERESTYKKKPKTEQRTRGNHVEVKEEDMSRLQALLNEEVEPTRACFVGGTEEDSRKTNDDSERFFRRQRR
ncbi:hypothetical protein BDR26DRAFT_914811 [Obelidium mucronatum]|nr:hypothetical protein BDR26DRAFT_914811 [Obelidium mucronatum]